MITTNLNVDLAIFLFLFSINLKLEMALAENLFIIYRYKKDKNIFVNKYFIY